jgi:tight adherence protein B
MDAPISHEFDLVFSEINYGSDVRRAMLSLLERVPSVSVMAFVTAVLVQKETGGNLTETLERITTVIRGRFKLQRRIKTLSAEGRLSAWIQTLMTIAAGMGVAGILWIRRVIRIEV